MIYGKIGKKISFLEDCGLDFQVWGMGELCMWIRYVFRHAFWGEALVSHGRGE